MGDWAKDKRTEMLRIYGWSNQVQQANISLQQERGAVMQGRNKSELHRD